MWKFFIVNELYFEFAEVAIWPCFAKKLLLKYETVLDKQLWRGLSFFKLQFVALGIHLTPICFVLLLMGCCFCKKIFHGFSKGLCIAIKCIIKTSNTSGNVVLVNICNCIHKYIPEPVQHCEKSNQPRYRAVILT